MMNAIRPTIKHLPVFCAALLFCVASAAQAEPDFPRAIALPDDDLLGRSPRYEKAHLAALDFTVGGIGSGCLRLNGEGRVHRWSNMGNSLETGLPDSFFAFAAKSKSGTRLHALQKPAVGKFAGASSLSFRGVYPYGVFDYGYADSPVAVRMTVFNPKIPLNLKDSALPAAVLVYDFRNDSQETQDITFLASQFNPVGYRDDARITSRKHPGLATTRNTVSKQPDHVALFLDSALPEDWAGSGDMTLRVYGPAERYSGLANWGALKELEGKLASGQGLGFTESASVGYPWVLRQESTLVGALASQFELPAGQSKRVAVLLTWNFPNVMNGVPQFEGWQGRGHQYANWFEDSRASAAYLAGELPRLSIETARFVRALYQSSLPTEVLNRINAQLAILASPSCFLDGEGRFGGWEGRWQESGSCAGNCTHVWAYAQMHARLWPALGRSMREQEFAAMHPAIKPKPGRNEGVVTTDVLEFYDAAGNPKHGFNAGAIPFRIGSPNYGMAFDGQMGAVLGSYREYLCSTDAGWLREHWPKIRMAMEAGIESADQDRDGWLSGLQHNTLDASLAGMSSWHGSMYLAALKAASAMARLAGDPEAEKAYAAIARKSQHAQRERLFNGEYFIHIPEQINDASGAQTETQQVGAQVKGARAIGNGCAIDQLLGQWWADQLGLGDLYERDRMTTAMKNLFRYNFKETVGNAPQKPRKFVSSADGGMHMITWPKGDRPKNHVKYESEIMSGFEYAAAATMLSRGLKDEPFTLLRAIAKRYDGRLRPDTYNRLKAYNGNPFGDIECGFFYTRPLSIWSVMTAYQGGFSNTPEGILRFAPPLAEPEHRSVFVNGTGWGLYEQRLGTGLESTLSVAYGSVDLRSLELAVPEGKTVTAVQWEINGQAADCRHQQEGPSVTLTPKAPTILKAGDVLKVRITSR